jgi:hypothetical protein
VKPKAEAAPKEFPPYATYLHAEGEAHDFVQLSKIGLDLADHLLFVTPQSSLRPSGIKPPSDPLREASFSMGDVDVREIDLEQGWLPFPEYAKQAGLAVTDVERDASAGLLGRVERTKRGEPLVLWPPEARELPESDQVRPGTWRFTATAEVRAQLPSRLDPHDDVAHEYLRLAHALGDPAIVKPQAEAMLFRTGLLLQWTAFEVFVRHLTLTLLRRHPWLLAEEPYAPDKLTLAQVMKSSRGLTSMAALRKDLLLKVGDIGIHSLLEGLRQRFNFEHDPFTAWFQITGQRRSGSFADLIRLKERRNDLVHERLPARDELDKVPSVTEAEYDTARLRLRAVAYSFANSVVKQKYAVSGEARRRGARSRELEVVSLEINRTS